MKKIVLFILVFSLLIMPLCTAYAGSAQTVLESDMAAVFPDGYALDDDFVFVSEAPGGSSVTWSALKNGEPYTSIFGENGKYLPEGGSGSFEITLTATLIYGGEALEKSAKVQSYRIPSYKLNSLIYEMGDGRRVRHPVADSRIVAIDVTRNPRISSKVTVGVAVYKDGVLEGLSTGIIDKSGEIPLDCPLKAIKDREVKIFIWRNLTNCKPVLQPPEIQNPEYMADNSFFKDMVVTNGDGESISELTDKDSDTYYRFTKQVRKNTNSRSLRFYRMDNTNVQIARRSLDGIGGIVDISYDFLISKTDAERGLMYLIDTDGNYALSLIIQGSTLRDHKTMVTTKNIEPYTWYNVRAVLDFSDKTADIYLDGVLANEDVAFRSNSTALETLQIHNSAGVSESEMFIDNIVIKENSTDFYTQNFNTYNEGDTPTDWKYEFRGGSICTSEFAEEELTIYPQSIIMDIGRECNISGITADINDSVSLLYRVEASRDGENFVSVAQHMTTAMKGVVSDEFDAVRARYMRIWIYRATDENGNYVNAAINEVSLKVKEDSPLNVAPLAHVSVTSLYPGIDARGITDGICASYSKYGEWISRYEGNPKVYFSWDEPQTVSSVEIFNRLKGTDGVNTGTNGAVITFDDGSSVRVDDIPQDGTPKKIVLDEPKTISTMQIKLVNINSNPGLSEVRILTGDEGDMATHYITPWKTLKAPSGYSGEWIVSDDLDNDGNVDFVSARAKYVTATNNHHIASMCAFNLGGEALWTWGKKECGKKECGTTTVGSDLPCQIYDIDADGQKEVLFIVENELIILNGKTGSEEKRFTLPYCSEHKTETATDCILIADISGDGYADDIIVKTRYTDVWAFTKDWKPLWHRCMPGGMKAGHAPLPIDIDHDGHDEVLAGFCMIDDNGEEMWSLDKSKFAANLISGHVDSVAVMSFEKGMAASDMRFAVSPCGGRNFFIIDGRGNKLWESDTGIHYETLIKGKFTPDGTGKQIITNPVLDDSDEVGSGEYLPVFVYDYNNTDGTCGLKSENWGFTGNRYIHAINMGDEVDYIYQPSDNVLIDGYGNRRVQLVAQRRDKMTSMRWNEFKGYHNDMDGDGTQDITSVIVSGGEVYISVYSNPNGPKTAAKLGTGYNYTFY